MQGASFVGESGELVTREEMQSKHWPADALGTTTNGKEPAGSRRYERRIGQPDPSVTLRARGRRYITRRKHRSQKWWAWGESNSRQTV